MFKKKFVVVSDNHGWQGLYVNGKLVYQWYEVVLSDLAKYANLDFEEIIVREYIKDFPEKLETICKKYTKINV